MLYMTVKEQRLGRQDISSKTNDSNTDGLLGNFNDI